MVASPRKNLFHRQARTGAGHNATVERMTPAPRQELGQRFTAGQAALSLFQGGGDAGPDIVGPGCCTRAATRPTAGSPMVGIGPAQDLSNRQRSLVSHADRAAAMLRQKGRQ